MRIKFRFVFFVLAVVLQAMPFFAQDISYRCSTFTGQQAIFISEASLVTQVNFPLAFFYAGETLTFRFESTIPGVEARWEYNSVVQAVNTFGNLSVTFSYDTPITESSIVYWDGPGDLTVYATCSGVNGATAAEVPIRPPDNRLNWGQGDQIAILFPSDDGIDVFLYDAYLSDFITNEEIAPFLDNPPSENTLIHQAGLLRVYILSTGEIQFNFGPDFEGKEYVLIMSDLVGSNRYGYYFDPNE